jgi:hypothetical protein
MSSTQGIGAQFGASQASFKRFVLRIFRVQKPLAISMKASNLIRRSHRKFFKRAIHAEYLRASALRSDRL